jgi:hypothetical protein
MNAVLNKRLADCSRRIDRLIKMVKLIAIIAGAATEEVKRQRHELGLDQ